MTHQQFDDHGHMLCIGCERPITRGEFWIELRQRTDQDADARLAAHPACIRRMF